MHIKTIFIVILLFVTNTLAVAQKRANGASINAFQRGAFQIGIASNYTLGTQKTVQGYYGTSSVSRDSLGSSSHYGVTASVGYFLNRNILLGANLNHTWRARPAQALASDSSSATHLAASGLLRAYAPLSTKAAMYLEAEFGYTANILNTIRYAQDYGINRVVYSATSNTSGLGGAVGIGAVIFVSEKCSFDAGVRYHAESTKGGTLSFYSNSVANIVNYTPTYINRSGIGARLGVQFFLFK